MKKIQQKIYQLFQWLWHHPVKAILFIGAAAVVGRFWRALEDMGESVALYVMIILMALLYAGWAWAYSRDTRKVIALLAGSLMLATQTQAQVTGRDDMIFEPAVQYALGGVILLASCAIGYVGCRANRACNKIPRHYSTNLIEEFVVAGEACEEGAAFFWAEPCYQERFAGTHREPVVMMLHLFIESETNCQSSLSFDVGSQSVMDLDGLKEELAGHGLFVPDSPRISESYSRNRHPISVEQSRFKFNFETRTATVGGGGVTVRVDSAVTLPDWRPLVRINAPVGTALGIPDVSHGRMFYRVTTEGKASP